MTRADKMQNEAVSHMSHRHPSRGTVRGNAARRRARFLKSGCLFVCGLVCDFLLVCVFVLFMFSFAAFAVSAVSHASKA